MKTFVRLVLATALIALGVWLWTVLFPSPERVIRKRLAAIARAASFGPNEGGITKLANVQFVVGCFSPDVAVHIESLGRGELTLNGRDDISAAVLAARSHFESLNIAFLDINIALEPDKQSATVDLTAKAIVPGQKDFEVQEMKFTLKKIKDVWLITRVETVKVLSGIWTGKVLLVAAAE